MMKSRTVITFLVSGVLLVVPGGVRGQDLRGLEFASTKGLTIQSIVTRAGSREELHQNIPLFSLLLNDSLITSDTVHPQRDGDSLLFVVRRGVRGSLRSVDEFEKGWKGLLTIFNSSSDTIRVANVVPLGEGRQRVYITATGSTTWPNYLSRSALFRPGVGPIGVVLPDDAWEMGFCDVSISPDRSLVAIARRIGSEKGDERRFRTILPPGGLVRYVLYLDMHPGDWHDGLRLMFQQRWLFDLDSFDDGLFQRADLQWIRHSYLLTILFAWDHRYYDAMGQASHLEGFLREQERWFGRTDAFILWPTWPRMGVDQRNQFDLYKDLPGGLRRLHSEAAMTHRMGTKYFVSYNPWDKETRDVDHLAGMKGLLRSIDADGVVLDTWGASSKEFQSAVDSVRQGIVLYSEGMAVPSDMPGIVAGRVHDALFMPPPLNLNKLIKPEFAIFRVLQVAGGRLHREAAVCLFNGYGAELNLMFAGRPTWMDEEYRYLGRVVKTLRENSDTFLSRGWTPLVPTTLDSVWVNVWPTPTKTVFSVYSLRPEGFQGALCEAPVAPGMHYVSLWHHAEIDPVSIDGKTFIPATVEGFSRTWLGSRREANVDCIAWLPDLLQVHLDRDTLHIGASEGDTIVVSTGDPAYGSPNLRVPSGVHAISLQQHFGTVQGKLVVQLFRAAELLDERILTIEPGTPHLIAASETSPRIPGPPEGMIEIPAGMYSYVMTSTDVPNPVIPYPDFSHARMVAMPRFYIDTFPVTNSQFGAFMLATHYTPKDATNFLKHWAHGHPPKGQEHYPVVWVSRDDARAYSSWAGKRIPTDIEWQYAAQGMDGRIYPWGNLMDSNRCNAGLGYLTAVNAHPSGKSPFGVMDLVGNVWQIMNDVYDNGNEYFELLRGGSFYNPTASEWYVKGGPWRVDQHQMLLMVGPGFDRNATVGFRCVKDAR